MLADNERQRWQKRIKAAHPWLCSRCKTSFAVQDALVLPRHCEVVRHSVCGHVLFWSSGTSRLARFVEPYRQRVLPRGRRQAKQTPRQKPNAA